MDKPVQFISKMGSRIATTYRSLLGWADSSPSAGAVKRVLFVVLFAALVAGLLVAVQKVPEWQVKRASVRSTKILPESETTPSEVAKLQDEMRKTFVQVVGGVFVVLALYFTYRRTRVTEQGHITDRYTKAIEQLGATKEVNGETKPNVEVRLGAIYALERIALDSPRDHWTIMEVLTAYVRENAPAPETEPMEEENKKAVAKGPATEIQAVLTVLNRRRTGGARERGRRLDLRKCDLRGADFYQAHLSASNFAGAHVKGANFGGAHLERAHLAGAHLEGANFVGARLGKAHLAGSHLEGANFRGAHVEGANIAGVKGLTTQQIGRSKGWEKANYDKETARKLGLAPPEEPKQRRRYIVPKSGITSD